MDPWLKTDPVIAGQDDPWLARDPIVQAPVALAELSPPQIPRSASTQSTGIPSEGRTVSPIRQGLQYYQWIRDVESDKPADIVLHDLQQAGVSPQAAGILADKGITADEIFEALRDPALGGALRNLGPSSAARLIEGFVPPREVSPSGIPLANDFGPDTQNDKLTRAVERLQRLPRPKKGFVEYMPGADFAIQFSDFWRQKGAGDRFAKGTASSNDIETLSALLVEAARSQDDTKWDTAWEVIKSMPAYAATFYFTSPVYTAGRHIATKVGEKLVKDTIRRTLAARVAGAVASRAVGVTAQTVANPLMIAASAMRQMQRDIKAVDVDELGRLHLELGSEKNLGTGIAKGFFDTFIELGTERAGSILTRVPWAKIPVANKVAGWKSALAKRWFHLGKSPTELLTRIKTGVGWHGIAGEIFEEEIGRLPKAALDIEPLPTFDQWMNELSVEAMAFSVVGAVMAGPQLMSSQSADLRSKSAKAMQKMAATESSAGSVLLAQPMQMEESPHIAIQLENLAGEPGRDGRPVEVSPDIDVEALATALEKERPSRQDFVRAGIKNTTAAQRSKLAERQKRIAEALEVARQYNQGTPIEIHAPRPGIEEDIADFMHQRDKVVLFFDARKTKFGGGAADNGVVLIGNHYENPDPAIQDRIWHVLGHELGHHTGLDKILPASSEEMLEAHRRRGTILEGISEEERAYHDAEARSDIMGQLFTDPGFRAQLARDKPTLWQRLRAFLKKVFGRWTPKDARMAMVLDELRTGKVAQPESAPVQGPEATSPTPEVKPPPEPVSHEGPHGSMGVYTREEAQRQIDEFEDELVSKYGSERILTYDGRAQLTSFERDQLQALYTRRDSLDKQEQSNRLSRVIDRLPRDVAPFTHKQVSAAVEKAFEVAESRARSIWRDEYGASPRDIVPVFDAFWVALVKKADLPIAFRHLEVARQVVRDWPDTPFGQNPNKHLEVAERLFDALVRSSRPDGMLASTAKPTPLPRPDVTSIKNRIVDELRARAGREAIPPAETRRWTDVVLPEAFRRIEENPNYPEELREELLKTKRGHDDFEAAALGILQRRLENAASEIAKRLQAARKTGDVAALAQAEMDAQVVSHELHRTELAARQAGATTARGLAARKMEFLPDYSLGAMVTRATNAKGGTAPTPTEFSDIEKRARKIGELERKVKDSETKRKPRKPGKPMPATTAEERRIAATLRALDAAIRRLEIDLAAGRIGPFQQPMPVSTPEIEAKRQRLAELKAIRERMRAESPTYQQAVETKREEIYRRNLERRLADWKKRIAEKDFGPRAKPERKLSQKTLDLKWQLEQERAKFRAMEEAWKRQQRSLVQKALRIIPETLNASRALLTSLDLSAVLRQGGMATASHPAMAVKAMGPMFRAMASKGGEFRANQEIQSRPNAQLYGEAGLSLTVTEGTLSAQEEAYMGRWGRFIPLVAASERAYVTFLNRIRADLFDSMTASISPEGAPTLDEAKAIANFINVSTGRGSLGQFQAAAVPLATVFFAPKFTVSRFQLLIGQPLWKGTARTRLAVAKEYARAITGAGLFYGMILLFAGGSDDPETATVELDPRSADFGKVRFGNTRLDPMAGLSQATVVISRTASGQTKTTTGRIRPIRGAKVPYGGATTPDVLARFLRSKLSPWLGSVVDIVSGENLVGEPVTPLSVTTRMTVPLSTRDIFEVMQDQGVPRGTALSLLAIFGQNLQTYEPRKWKRK